MSENNHMVKVSEMLVSDAPSVRSTTEGSTVTTSELGSAFSSNLGPKPKLLVVKPEAPRSQTYPVDGEWSWEFSMGRTYSGQWVSQKMEGEGQMTWPNGQIYVGQFMDNKKHGLGRFSWPDGRSYQGQWVLGKQHGIGTYTDAEGREWTGKWENGKKGAQDDQP